MSSTSEERIEPLDGIIARVLCNLFYSRIETFMYRKSFPQPFLFVASFLVAFTCCLAFVFQYPILGGVLSLFYLLLNLLTWKQVIIASPPRFWIVLGSTIDRVSEALIFSGILLSPFLETSLEYVIGFLALIGSLTVSYIATKATREFGKFIWKSFSAYGATRDIRLAIIAISSIIGIIPWGLACLTFLTFAVICMRLKGILS